nr:bis(5'-adenosyl)-triphosphatase ENPP4-like isoform X2 [Lepeophtheirus salmonis]
MLLTLWLFPLLGGGVECTRTLFVVLDGFRFDYVKLFQTPNIARITNGENTFFHPGILPVFPTTTLPNLASMITGNFSDTHGITIKDPVHSHSKKDVTPSSPEYWGKLRKMGTIWDSYVDSATSHPHKPPGLISWPFSTIIDSSKDKHYKHVSNSKTLASKLSSIKSMFTNDSLDFVSVYVDEPGSYAVPYGPESMQVNESISKLDAWIGELVKEFKEDTNIIITSTPGYLNVTLSNVIYLHKILEKGTYSVHGNSPFLSIVPKEGEEINIFQILDQQTSFKTYYKNNIPANWHYVLDPTVKIALLASQGQVFEDFFKTVKRFHSKHGIKEPLERTYGLSGYMDNLKNSSSILLGIGPAFKKETSKSFLRDDARVVDIYALLSHVLGLDTSNNDREGRLDVFTHDLSNPPIETIERIKKVINQISNTPAAGAIAIGSLMLITLLLCVIILYRKKSKKLDHSYSYTQISYDQLKSIPDTLIS